MNLVNLRLKPFTEVVLASYQLDEKSLQWLKIKKRFLEKLSLSEQSKIYDSDREFIKEFEIVLQLDLETISFITKRISVKLESNIPIGLEDIKEDLSDKEIKELYKKLNVYLSVLFSNFDDEVIVSEIEIKDNHSITFDNVNQCFVLEEKLNEEV